MRIKDETQLRAKLCVCDRSLQKLNFRTGCDGEFRRLRQVDPEFKASRSYLVRLYFEVKS